jgi:hypothetical protein
MWTIVATVTETEKAVLTDVAASLRAVECPTTEGPDEVCDLAAKTLNSVAEAEDVQACIDGVIALRKLLIPAGPDLLESATGSLREACFKAWPALGPLALHPDPVVQSHALFVLRTLFPLIHATDVEAAFESLLVKCAETLPLHRSELLLRVAEIAILKVSTNTAASTDVHFPHLSKAIFARFAAADETVAFPWPLVAAAGRLAAALAARYADVVKPARAKSRNFDSTTIIDDAWVRTLSVFATSALAAYAGFCSAKPSVAAKQGAEIAAIANSLTASIINLSAERHLVELRVLPTVAAFLKMLRPAYTAAAARKKPFEAAVAAAALWDVVREGVRKNVSNLEMLVDAGLLSLSLDYVDAHGDAGSVTPALWTISIFQLDRKLSAQMLRAGGLNKTLPLVHHPDPVARSLSAYLIGDYACCVVPGDKAHITELDYTPETVALALGMSVSEMNELRKLTAAVLTTEAICEIIDYAVTLTSTKSSQDPATRELRGFATLIASAIATAPPGVQSSVFESKGEELLQLDQLVQNSPFKAHVTPASNIVGAILQFVRENSQWFCKSRTLLPVRMNRVIASESNTFRALWRGVKLPKGVVA